MRNFVREKHHQKRFPFPGPTQMDALLDTNTKTHEGEAISQSEERKLSGLSFIKRTKRLFAEQLSGILDGMVFI